MNIRMNEELMEANSLSEMLKVLNKYYDLDNCKPSNMIKQIMFPKLLDALQKSGAAQIGNTTYFRTDVMTPASSMTEIMRAAHRYYDLDNCILSPLQKQKMISGLNNIVKAVGANQRRIHAA